MPVRSGSPSCQVARCKRGRGLLAIMSDRPRSAAASLTASRVTKSYAGQAALRDVSVDVQPGDCLALVGESGSGKTTLLRCFNRMVEPEAGRIQIDGNDVSTVDAVKLRRGIGYVPQDGGLIPHWTVQRNVELGLRLNEAKDMADGARAALDLVGLDPARFADRWPRDLSGGQRQRVAIARALAPRPSLLLLDEPFGALDAITRGDLQEVFGRLRREIAATCVLVTHDLQEAVRLADVIAVLRAGRVEQIDSVERVVAAPASEYVARLLDRAGVRSLQPTGR